MRPASPKRAAQQRVYLKLRRVYLEDHPRCGFPLGCDQPATDIHHKRGRVGVDLIDVTHWIGLCREHHHFVTVNPAAAFDLGVSSSRIGLRP